MNAWAVLPNRPVPFQPMAAAQDRLAAARGEERIPDTVFLLQHPPVVTLGSRGCTHHLLASPETLARTGIELARASRGGDVTYHGPGQLVLYPILRLGAREADAHGYLHNLEEVAIRTAGDFGVAAFRREGLSGAWTASGKIAAIGFRLKRWITLHGMSFNVRVDLDHFRLIVPCGLAAEPVTSLAALLADACPLIERARERMLAHFEDVFGRPLRRIGNAAQLPSEMRELLPPAVLETL